MSLMSHVIIINCQFTGLSQAFFERAEQCLSEPEKELFSAYNKPLRQQQYLAGHYLLRMGLTCLFGKAEEYWVIDQGVGTAPILINPPPEGQVYLSISHSKDRVVGAVSLNNPIGIDIENHVRERPFIEFSEQYLSPLELEKLEFLQGEKRKQYFYSLWTVMESVAKLRGSGLDQDIFNSRWDSQPDFCAEGASIHEDRYCTYTTGYGDFTLSLVTESLLEGLTGHYNLSDNGLQLLDSNFSQGCFLLNQK
jgi:phosphopantetheinyl transferase